MSKRSSHDVFSYTEPGDPIWKQLLISTVEWFSGKSDLTRRYDELVAANIPPHQVWAAALEQLEIAVDWNWGRIHQIPKSGPLVVIANHPFGILDGLMLANLMSQRRQDFSFMVNSVLCRDSIVSDHLLPISFDPTKEAQALNIQTRKQALDRLHRGEAMLIFPAGGVATMNGPFGKVEDLEWKRFTAQLIQRSHATVLPVFFHGKNSPIFQWASQISQNLRLGLLLHEVRNKMGTTLKMEIGAPIPFDEISHIKSRQELLDHLKEVVFNLGDQIADDGTDLSSDDAHRTMLGLP
ncbi:lysophospholipid acyltransferase family protein [Pontibacter sp. G13]|uniref:lysophospholipid acyltransferase family protein n=1 Tax=Pontibacter sp. G13 TaxID=3074898 RepID=UPI00288C0A8B|nr:lysophospholipid acyltransferase family protein [Pontibacter sp. G13]WNJ18941.1 lysophospholipid acyltransferase family protein [Pontibacter sp. G13]